jgi:hypothetical protein
MEQTMKVVHIGKKKKRINAKRTRKQGLQMNEALTNMYNLIYDILIKTNSNTRNPTHSRTLYPPPHYSTSTPSPIPPPKHPPSPLYPLPFPHSYPGTIS